MQPVDAKFLLSAAYAKSTRARYSDAVGSFFKWANDNEVHVPSDGEALDELVVEYLHGRFTAGSGSGKTEASQLVYGLVMRDPRLKGRLHMSKLALRGWQRLKPAVPYPPMSFQLVALVATSMAKSGDALMAVATLVAFEGLLRIGELVNLQREDVVMKDDKRLGSANVDMALRLKRTKTGANKWAVIRHPQIQRLLERVLTGLSMRDRVFPFSASTFRRRFKAHCSLLGLNAGYVPHSLRHGKATLLFLQGVPMSEILILGRWAASKSAENYVQAGRALLLDVNTPQRARLAGDALAKDLFSALALAQRHFVQGGRRARA